MVDPDQFRDHFKTVMEEHVGPSPNPRTWRQMAIGIAREYMLPHLLEQGTTTSSDVAAHHTSAISRAHYARNGGDLPALSNDAVCEHRAAGHAWHDILGVGANEPPVPVRLLHQRPAATTRSTAEVEQIVTLAVQQAVKLVQVPRGGEENAPDDVALQPAPSTPPSVEAAPIAVEPSSQLPPSAPAPHTPHIVHDISDPLLDQERQAVTVEQDEQEAMILDDPPSVPSSAPPRKLGKRKRVVVDSDEEEEEGAGGDVEQYTKGALSLFRFHG
jgi:stage V sporulation protein SpoVS